MGLWNQIKGFSDRIKRGIYAAVANPYEGPGYNFTKWFSPRNIFQGRSNQVLETNEIIFSAVSKLSNGMAVLPLKLYKEFQPVNSAVADLLANAPNNNMTSFDFIRTLEALRNTSGNTYAIKLYGSNFQVESLHILDPNRVNPVYEESSMELWYEIQGTKNKYYVHNMDIIHLKHIHGFGFKGINPIDVLKNTIDFDAEVRKFSLEQMDGAKASFILKYDQNVSPEKRAEVIEDFKAFYRDNGGILFQEPGVTIDQLDQEFINTDAFAVEKVTRSRVASVYNMPAHMLGETEGSSFSTMEQLSLEFVQSTLLPIVKQYEQEFNRKLLTKEERKNGYYFKFNVKSMLRGDTATQMEAWFKGLRSAIYTPNEIRAWEELPPDPNGDKLMMSGDLYPLELPIDQRSGKVAAVPTPSKGGGEN